MGTQRHIWTVVAAGPSLEKLDPDRVAAMPNTVAVNRAFYWLDGRAHAWIANENPGKLWNAVGIDRVRELLKPSTELWIPKSAWYNAWKREFGSHRNRRAYDRNMSRYVPGKRCTSPGWDTELTWSSGTTNVALARCCALGAREITLIGCDLHGTGGWGYTYKDEEEPRWKTRWKNERIALNACIKEASDHGVRIRWERAGSS